MSLDLDKLWAIAKAYDAAPDDGAYDEYDAFSYAFDSDTCLALIARIRELERGVREAADAIATSGPVWRGDF